MPHASAPAPSPSGAAAASLLPPRDTTRRPRSTPAAGAVLGLFAAAAVILAPARAQPPSSAAPADRRVSPPTPTVDGARAPVAPGADVSRPPAPDAALRTFRTLEGWFAGWSLPAAAPTGEFPRAHGASIILRLEGKPLADASSVTFGGSLEPGDGTIWDAAVRAFAEADRRAPLERDALRPQRLAELAAGLTLSLELAGVLTPIEPATALDLDATLAPGVEGLAIRQGGRIEAIFPASMLLSNLTPSDAARALVSRVTGEPALGLLEPAALRQNHKLSFYKFRTLHLAQTRPGESPRFLDRGDRLVLPAQVDSLAELAAMAEAMASNLVRRAHVGGEPLGLFGTYFPWSGRYDPTVAPPAEQALAALALARHARQPAISPASRDLARAAVDQILADLADVRPVETAPWEDLGASALYILAATDAGLQPNPPANPPADPALGAAVAAASARCAQRVAAAWSGGRFTADTPPALTGLVAAALARAGEREPVRRVFADTSAATLVSHMPWLGWAELSLAAGQPAIPAAPALREMRALLWRHQLGPKDVGPDGADLVGGVVFTASRNPLPNWHVARPAAFAAAMLRDARLTSPAERPGELVRLLGAVRFLRQLQMDEDTQWLAVVPEAAAGGLRSAPWDARMPIDATAMGLLAVHETILSVQAISEPTPPPPPTPPTPTR